MKKRSIRRTVPLFILLASLAAVRAQEADTGKEYIIRHESEILGKSPSLNRGNGEILGNAFFDDEPGCCLSYRKRVLQSGASLGKHLQKHDEIDCIVSGEGILRMNDAPVTVKSGDAILSRTGNSHELLQTRRGDLVVLAVFGKES